MEITKMSEFNLALEMGKYITFKCGTDEEFLNPFSDYIAFPVFQGENSFFFLLSSIMSCKYMQGLIKVH